MKIYLLRHGESEGNRDNKFRGRTDFPLTNNGKKQAHSAGQFLKDVQFDIIYTSPLKRALKTAEIVNEYIDTKIIIEEQFNNIQLGAWEGKDKNYIKEHYPQEWKIWINNPEQLHIDKMESLHNIQKRTFEGIEYIKQKNMKNVLIVTHRAVLKPLIAKMINITSPFFWKIHIDTAALTIIEWRKPTGWILKNLNINHYLNNFKEEIV